MFKWADIVSWKWFSPPFASSAHTSMNARPMIRRAFARRARTSFGTMRSSHTRQHTCRRVDSMSSTVVRHIISSIRPANSFCCSGDKFSRSGSPPFPFSFSFSSFSFSFSSFSFPFSFSSFEFSSASLAAPSSLLLASCPICTPPPPPPHGWNGPPRRSSPQGWAAHRWPRSPLRPFGTRTPRRNCGRAPALSARRRLCAPL
eukprot:GGOE01042629.1.p1 GENE.GGOE01042629.1~~GGOE01042629.1.p1  ORF type:complete len:202 (-),score=20.26 GGOE01042629.1:710-1315(-)